MDNVAVLGLGHMGAPIARRLVEQGHRVSVWNRTPARAAAITGARAAASPADAAAGAAVVITMLTDGPTVSAVVAQANLAPGTTLVDMSTIGPDAVRALRAGLPAGVDLVDAPVAGSVDAAASGKLRVLAGGDSEVVDRVEPILSALGQVRRCGGLGSGAALKLVINTALVTALASLADVLAVADSVGVARPDALDALKASPLGAAVQRALDGGGQFAIALAAKDLDLALGAAGGGLPVAEAAQAQLRAAMAAGDGSLDLAAVIS